MSMRATVLLTSTALILVACTAETPAQSDQAEAVQDAAPAAAETVAQPTEVIATIEQASVASPDGEIEFSIRTDNGQLRYSVNFQGEETIRTSRLGLRFAETFGLDENLEIIGLSEASSDSTWEQPWGERRVVRDHHNELLIEARRVEPDIRTHPWTTFRWFTPRRRSGPRAGPIFPSMKRRW